MKAAPARNDPPTAIRGLGNWHRDKRRGSAIVFVVAVLLLALLCSAIVGVLSSARAYVSGESLYSKGGHLIISGEKQIGVNHNVDVLRFSGQVDPRAIQTGNSVASAQIANVRIEQRGKGQQADAQGIGWLGRFFLNVLPI